jgi:hypothetical protein
MKFTVSFTAWESVDATYSIVFIPDPCWIRQGPYEADQDYLIVNMANDSRDWQGSVAQLLKAVPGLVDLVRAPGRSSSVAVVAHAGGHGTLADLAGLLRDLREEGFVPTVLMMPPADPDGV